jgi:hypothetical protein
MRARTALSAVELYLSPQVDGAGVDGMADVGADSNSELALSLTLVANRNQLVSLRWTFTPPTGSHIIAPAWAGSGTLTAVTNAAVPLQWTVREIVRPNMANNTTTSG